MAKNTVWLKFSVPVALKEDFKVACWLENTSQTDKILELMHQAVVSNKKEIDEAKRVRKS